MPWSVRRGWSETWASPKSSSLGVSVASDEDVSGLEVAVNDLVLVRMRERAEDRDRPLGGLLRLNAPRARESSLERLYPGGARSL